MTPTDNSYSKPPDAYSEGPWVASCAPLLVLIISLVSILSAASAIFWTSDDYVLVYGLDGRTVPRWAESLAHGGEGRISAHRTFGYPWNGYVGHALGPMRSHILQIVLHLSCGGLVWWLLRALYFSPETASWVAVFFLLSPWVTQTLFWWCCSGISIHTMLIVLAGLSYLRSQDSRKPWLWMIMSCSLVFAALTVYELWLFSWPLFAALDWYRLRLVTGGPLLQRNQVQRAVIRSLPMMIPYVLWAAWFMLSHSPDAARNPQVLPQRLLIVFFSTQVRSLQLILEVPWKESLKAGGRQFLDHLEVIVPTLALGIVGVLWLVRRAPASRSAVMAGGESTRGTETVRLMERLILAWIFLLSSRLVFVLQGGVAMWTRHNYGASIAWAIVFGSIVEFLLCRYSRVVVSALAGVVIALMGMSMAGIAEQYAEVSQLEERVYLQVFQEVSAAADTDCVIIVGTPEPSWGEMGFYFEESGVWLQRRLSVRFPEINAAVVSDIDQARGILAEWRQASDSGDVPNEALVLFHIDEAGVLTRQAMGSLERL